MKILTKPLPQPNADSALKAAIDLGESLVLRSATSADTDALDEFNHDIHDEDPDINLIGTLTRDFMSGKHPLIGPGDFTVVENIDTGEIVSSMCLISQTWSYGGIRFKLGRPELVGTKPAYRRRGLVRHQFEVIHQLSASRGELVQAITGIPWYYRLFGYEMAMHLGGGRNAYREDLPKFDVVASPYRLRPASLADLAFVRDLYQRNYQRYPFVVDLSDELWRYEFDGYSHYSESRKRWQIIETKTGERLGYVQHHPWIMGNAFTISQVELKAGHGYLNVLPVLLHSLWELGSETSQPSGKPAELRELRFRMGPQHPLYKAWPHGFHREIAPYAWFVRIPDLVAFLKQLRPALERHLVDSLAAGYAGELKWHNYRKGVHMSFDAGRITSIEDWVPEDWNKGDAAFPERTFLQLLCGRRRCGEITAEHADAWSSNDAEVLLDILFAPFEGTPWVIG